MYKVIVICYNHIVNYDSNIISNKQEKIKWKLEGCKKMNSKEWFKEAKFGMMVHFGLYSVLAGEWKGKRMPYIGEWIQAYYRIPNNEYHELAKVFNPIYFDADEWIRVAKSGGAKYIVVTSKHHDGFALYHSKVDKFNCVDSSPFKRDIIGELADACARQNLKLGIYYSQELDWSHPHGGGYGANYLNLENTTSWTNDWDFPDNSKKNYSICFAEKIKPQMEELLKNYGKLAVMWCDMPFDITKEQSTELYNMIKHYQPECLVNSRMGNNVCDFGSSEDNLIVDDIGNNQIYEMPGTLNDTWGYKSFDNNWKSPEEILRIKKHLNSIGSNYLLNIGPDYLGRIPAPASEIFSKIGK